MNLYTPAMQAKQYPCNTWSVEVEVVGRILKQNRYWVTRNGVRVDLSSTNFRAPYLTSQDAAWGWVEATEKLEQIAIKYSAAKSL